MAHRTSRLIKRDRIYYFHYYENRQRVRVSLNTDDLAVAEEKQRQFNTPHMELGSPRASGYIESFNGKIGDELFKCEIFGTLLKANALAERWRCQ
jgi:hypothetical protein